MSQKINLSTTPGQFMPYLYYSQGDIGREFEIALLSSDGFTIPSGATVEMVATKPSGFGFTVSGTLTDNVATFVTTETMTNEWGRFPAEIRIKSGSDVIGTANFYLSGEQDPHPDSTIDGDASEIIPELTLLVERVETAAASVLDMEVVAETLPAGSDATYTYDEETNTATFGIPKGADGSLSSGVLAPTYSSSATYAVGDYVYYSGNLYRCTTAITTAEAWTSGHWTQVALAPEVSDVKSDFDEVAEIIYPKNIYNPSEAVQGTLNTSGGVNESTYITTGMIPVSQGDVLYAYFVQNGEFKAGNMYYVVSLFDESQTFISRTSTLFSQSYTVPSSVKYIRATFQITYTVYKDVVMVTKNETAIAFEKYFTPYLSAVDDVARGEVNTKIIDCWGDSRVEMIATSETAFSDYLLGLLGSDYITANYGVSSQNANMVAARFGSNEVFVTFENNQIPASGNANITAFKCSVGGRAGEDFRAQSINLPYGVHCEIAGVKGTIIRRYSTEQYFVRDEAGTAVSVKPRTKAIVPYYNSKNHICIFWAGKNDFGFNVAPRTEGIITSIESMAKSLAHNYFIILGETYSVNENYAAGTTFRNVVNTINAYYASNYPNNYIDIQAELISQGLSLEGITPTAQDTENIANGFIPDSLMADAVHPNEKGREAVAKIIYSWMQSKGWI